MKERYETLDKERGNQALLSHNIEDAKTQRKKGKSLLKNIKHEMKKSFPDLTSTNNEDLALLLNKRLSSFSQSKKSSESILCPIRA